MGYKQPQGVRRTTRRLRKKSVGGYFKHLKKLITGEPRRSRK